MARKSVLPRTPGIYEIVNAANGKRYVGSAVNLSKRWVKHRCELAKGNHNPILLNAWRKYGAAAFAFRIIELVADERDLIRREQHYLDTLNPEYNVCKVAGSPLGVKHPPEFGAAISARNKGVPRPKPPGFGEALSALKRGVPNPKNVGNKSPTGQKQGALEIERRSKALRANWAERKANGAATAAKQIAGLKPGSKPGRRNKTKKTARKTQPDLFD